MAWFENWFDSKYYHLLYGERDENEADFFLNNLLQLIDFKNESKVLDLACGNGRHAQFFADKAFEIWGIDLSENNINFAQNRNIGTFEVLDMRTTYKSDFFDLVLNLFTSFGYFENPEDNIKTLNSVHLNLNQNGIFVQDYMNSEKIIQDLVPYEKKNIQEIEFEIHKSIQNNCIIKDISFVDQNLRFEFQERVHLLKLKDFENMYQQVGLNLIHIFGDYDLSPFNPQTSNRLILISKK